MTNTKVPVHLVLDACRSISGVWSLHPNYSGAGMYSTTCFGLVVESLSSAFEFTANLSYTLGYLDGSGGLKSVEGEEFSDLGVLGMRLAESVEIDSLISYYVVYFPGFDLSGHVPSWADGRARFPETYLPS